MWLSPVRLVRAQYGYRGGVGLFVTSRARSEGVRAREACFNLVVTLRGVKVSWSPTGSNTTICDYEECEEWKHARQQLA